MKYRKLRIAWSAVCGIICLLLIALWVRSYLRCDMAYGPLPSGEAFMISTTPGEVYAIWYAPNIVVDWGFESNARAAIEDIPPSVWALGFGLYWDGGVRGFKVPFWFPIISVTALLITVILRSEWRFRLRTLIIGVVVVTALWGLVIWASK